MFRNSVMVKMQTDKMMPSRPSKSFFRLTPERKVVIRYVIIGAVYMFIESNGKCGPFLKGARNLRVKNFF